MATTTATPPTLPMATAFFSHRPPRSLVAIPSSKGYHVLRRTNTRVGTRRWASVKATHLAREDTGVDVEGLVHFLYGDLPHLFDGQGIDRSMYDDRVVFIDPITKYDSIGGYLFNIGMLRILFSPEFTLHNVRQTGPLEITTRWTMQMRFVLLPWKPTLVFSGVSIMTINPQTGKFCSHVDLWDSIENNEHFSLEGAMEVIKQCRYYKTPDLDTPKYKILKKMKRYEVRQYAPFIIVETEGDRLSGSAGFNNATGYIFGKNASSERIPMTTPVFTQAVDSDLSKVSLQIVMPSDKQLGKLPDPLTDSVKLRKVEGGFAAALIFSGKASEEIVREKEKELRSELLRDGLKPQEGCLLARYNDPGRTWSFTMRNEVLIWLDGFALQ